MIWQESADCKTCAEGVGFGWCLIDSDQGQVHFLADYGELQQLLLQSWDGEESMLIGFGRNFSEIGGEAFQFTVTTHPSQHSRDVYGVHRGAIYLMSASHLGYVVLGLWLISLAKLRRKRWQIRYWMLKWYGRFVFGLRDHLPSPSKPLATYRCPSDWLG